MAQCARREREQNERRRSTAQLGQRLRRERERLGECVQTTQSIDFTSLTPSLLRPCLEQGIETTNVIQPPQKRTMVAQSSTRQTNWYPTHI